VFLDTLSSEARQLLTRLAREPQVRSFYLAGGSAAALHLGHRISVDLDFFTEQDDYQAELLIQRLQAVGLLEIQQQSRGTLNARLAGVRISFFVYPYPLLAEMMELDGIRVAGLLDIALMKLATISQRGAKRDFVDLYFICHSGYTLDDLLRRVAEKYPTVSYPSYHLLRALVYFADAEADESPSMLVSWDWTEIKRFFEDEVRRLMQEL
jgi:hypothetical protein